jgi:hypothetical protein
MPCFIGLCQVGSCIPMNQSALFKFDFCDLEATQQKNIILICLHLDVTFVKL